MMKEDQLLNIQMDNVELGFYPIGDAGIISIETCFDEPSSLNYIMLTKEHAVQIIKFLQDQLGDVRQLDIETAIKTYYKSKGLVQAHVELRKLVNRIETESALALDSADWISLEGNEDKLQEFIEHDGDCLIKFDNDQICNYNDHDLPMAIITHFKKII